MTQNSVKLLQPESPELLTNVNTPAEFASIGAGIDKADNGPAAG